MSLKKIIQQERTIEEIALRDSLRLWYWLATGNTCINEDPSISEQIEILRQAINAINIPLIPSSGREQYLESGIDTKVIFTGKDYREKWVSLTISPITERCGTAGKLELKTQYSLEIPTGSEEQRVFSSIEEIRKHIEQQYKQKLRN